MKSNKRKFEMFVYNKDRTDHYLIRMEENDPKVYVSRPCEKGVAFDNEQVSSVIYDAVHKLYIAKI